MSISFAYNLTYPGPAFPVAEIAVAGAAGRPINSLSALIDTGADATMIPLDILVAIGARRIDTRIMRTVDGSRNRVRLFSIAVIIGPYTVHGVDAVANETTPEVILGRDVLNQLVVTLDGLAQTTDIEYYADIPANTRVYLSRPEIGIPKNKRGPKATNPRVLPPASMRVDDLRHHPKTLWQTLTLRPTERGMLTADFARIRVWTVDDDLTVTEEWLLIRRDGKKHSYSMSNAPIPTPLKTMALRKSQRYFIERSNQDVKSEFGWDEFQATKFQAWEHQLALTILAQWFIAETRLDWQDKYARDPELLHRYQTTILPTLSVANVRALLRAAMPLPQLSPAEAAALVVKHLDNRTRSRSSRMQNRAGP